MTVYLYLRHFLSITRDEERQRLKTFRTDLRGLPTRSYTKCELLTYPCGLLSAWTFVLWASVRVGFCLDTTPETVKERKLL